METITAPIRKPRRSYPELVYERWGGKTYYRKGYRDVLKNRKTPAEIMGASGLQSFIVSFINGHLHGLIDHNQFRMLTNEPGLHIGRGGNLACDVMVYDKTVLTNDKITVKYVDVPPKVSIEVDVKVELKNETEIAYVFNKTRQLFAFGAQKVIWVLTDLKQVLVFTAGVEAVVYLPWNRDIEVVDNVSFNIGAYLESEGFVL